MWTGWKRKRLFLLRKKIVPVFVFFLPFQEEKKRSKGWKDGEREGKMERMGREGRDVMRHCMVVQKEMSNAEGMRCLIEWIQAELKYETSWYQGSRKEYDLLTDCT